MNIYPSETETQPPNTFVLPAQTLSAEEFAARIAEFRRRRDDAEYIASQKQLAEDIAEYRRQIQADANRELDQVEGK